MARIKKQGLDYFPLDTDFLQQRTVRRLMKQQGDRAFTVLVSTLSAIYGGQGYYVRADRLFCEDLAADLFDTDARQVQTILETAVECGIFDARLYAECGILTSAYIQEQYLFCAKRRKKCGLDAGYRLIGDTPRDADDTAPADTDTPNTDAADTPTDANTAAPADADATPKAETSAVQPGATSARNAENVTFKPENVTLIPQSKAQQSIAKHSKEKPLLPGSPDNGGTPDAGRMPAPDEEHDEHFWAERIARLTPPADHQRRNYDGLLFEMRRYKIPPQEQYALILKSGFGTIGHPVWQGLATC